MSDSQYTLTSQNLKSILIGALINLSGTLLLTFGLFLQQGNFTESDWQKVGYALLANLGAVIVNTVRKFISVE